MCRISPPPPSPNHNGGRELDYQEREVRVASWWVDFPILEGGAQCIFPMAKSENWCVMSWHQRNLRVPGQNDLMGLPIKSDRGRSFCTRSPIPRFKERFVVASDNP